MALVEAVCNCASLSEDVFVTEGQPLTMIGFLLNAEKRRIIQRMVLKLVLLYSIPTVLLSHLSDFSGHEKWGSSFKCGKSFLVFAQNLGVLGVLMLCNINKANMKLHDTSRMGEMSLEHLIAWFFCLVITVLLVKDKANCLLPAQHYTITFKPSY